MSEHTTIANPATDAPLLKPDVPPLPPDATPEQKDEHWYKYVYQGDKMPQLTLRAVLVGGILGMLMSAANLYTTLSIGWSFGIAITACVLSFVMWNFVVLTSGKRVSQMSVLENACMASTASAAGYSTGSTIATMFGALVLLKDVPPGTPLSSIKTWDVTAPWIVVVFTLCTGLMGVFLAIPMKRQQINHEQLPFPSGIAAAETLRSLYSASKEAILKAYVLVLGLASGLVIGFLRVGDDVLEQVRGLRKLFEHIDFLRIPGDIHITALNRLYPGGRLPQGMAFEPSALLIAAGMIVGMRTSLSLVLSSLLLYGVVGPRLAAQDAAHFTPASQPLIAAIDSASEGQRDLAQLATTIGPAVQAAASQAGLDNPSGLGQTAAGAAQGALDEIDTKLAKKQADTMSDAAASLGLSGSQVRAAAKRAQRDAEHGPDKAQTGAALAAAVRLARAQGIDPDPMLESVAAVEREAEERNDKAVGDAVLAAITAQAADEKLDTARLTAAADTARAKARANPGRESSKAAKDAAVTQIYDEQERDPRPFEAKIQSVTDAENARAKQLVTEAVMAKVLSEAQRLKLDTQAITASAEAGASAATRSIAAAIRAGAMEDALFQASRKGIADTSPLQAAMASSFTPDEQDQNRQEFVEAVRGAAAGRGANAFASAEANQAMAEAQAAARQAGKSYKKTVEAGEQAFEANRYHTVFIWRWGAHEIVLTRWSLWGGTAVMVFASLMSVAMQWRTLLRAFTGAKAAAGEGKASHSDVEVPSSWMIAGMLPITIAMVWLQIQAFNVSWYAGVIAVAMSFVLSLVGSRATGETDTTPVGAMGKVMQLLFAVLAPKNIAANLASAGIAANSASSSADLLTDLKTGYLLGANPRRQFLAQFFGVFFGTLAIVPIWYLMVPDRAKLETFAMPATRAWEAVARVLVKGVGELPPSAVWAIFIGAAVGMILPVIEKILPPKYRAYTPSATGIGLAWVMPFQNTFSFFIGAVIILLWSRVHKKSADSFNVPIASGLIAGESLMAAALAITATAVGLLS